MTESVPHQALSDPEPFAGSGKSAYQANPPLVSVNPTGEKQGEVNKFGEERDYKIIDKPNMQLTHGQEGGGGRWPFGDLEPGQGMFIATEKGSTTDKLMQNLYRAVADARAEFAEVERNRDGDEILDMVVVKRRLKNDDGSFQLGAHDIPLFGANQEQMPRLVYTSHYSVKAVVKGDDIGEGEKAEHDGAIVIRQV